MKQYENCIVVQYGHSDPQYLTVKFCFREVNALYLYYLFSSYNPYFKVVNYNCVSVDYKTQLFGKSPWESGDNKVHLAFILTIASVIHLFFFLQI